MNSELVRTIYPSPLGHMIILASGEGLCFVEFQKVPRNIFMEKRLKKWYTSPVITDGKNAFIESACSWLDDYFKKNFSLLEMPRLDLRGTDFELKVWEDLKNIPIGQTVSYGQIAGRLHKPTGARAVGGCVGRNPVSIIIPCHRVIGSGGSLTGYGGGLENKAWLLEHESLPFLKER